MAKGRSKTDASWQRLQRQLKSSPEARIRWLLDFSQRKLPDYPPDITGADERFLESSFEVLGLLQRGHRGWTTPATARGNQRISMNVHDMLAEFFAALARGDRFSFRTPRMLWIFKPPPPRQPGSRVSARIDRSNDLRILTEQAPPAILLNVVDDLDAVGADRLKACPLEDHAQRCGKVFLANGKQKFCTPAHAQRAAFLTYLAAGGDVKRKQNRPD